MSLRVDLNADLGESYGRWTLGDDASLMPHLTSANVACGFHGGDPHVMRRTVELAVEHGVAIGAHVGLPDLLGFGRRRLAISPDELKDYVLYQAGALAAFADTMGVPLQHVKPHGALYSMVVDDPALAAAVCEATRMLDGELFLLMPPDLGKAAAAAGIPFVPEGYVDLDYDASGRLVLERVKQLRDPQAMAERSVRLVLERKVPTVEGGELDLSIQSICVHGDAPNATAIASAIRAGLAQAGVEVVPLTRLQEGT